MSNFTLNISSYKVRDLEILKGKYLFVYLKDYHISFKTNFLFLLIDVVNIKGVLLELPVCNEEVSSFGSK